MINNNKIYMCVALSLCIPYICSDESLTMVL